MKSFQSTPDHSKVQSREPNRVISSNKFREWIFRARDSGNYFHFFRPFYRIMSKLDALFIQDLINLYSMSKKEHRDGYFLCTEKFLSERNWTGKEQEARFRSLIKRGYIRTERRGIPPRRWVFIDIENIEMALDGADNPSENHPAPNGAECEAPNGRLPGINKSSTKRGNKGECSKSLRDVAATPESTSSNQSKTPRTENVEVKAATRLVQDRTQVDVGKDSAKPQKPVSGDPVRSGDVSRNSPASPEVRGKVREEKPDEFGFPSRFALTDDREPTRSVSVEEFPIPPSPNDKPGPTPFDHELASRISKFARTQGWQQFGKQQNKSGVAIGVLRRKVGKTCPHPEQELLSRWNWYEKNYSPDGFRIRIRTPKELDQQWDILGDRVRKEAEQNPTMEITPEAMEIANAVSNYPWPMGADRKLPAAIQRSLNAVRDFRKKLSTLDVPQKHVWLRDHIFGEFGDSAFYIEKWFNGVNKRIRNWEDWSGNLDYFVWSPNHPDFKSWAEGVTTKANGCSREWFQLMEFMEPGKESRRGTGC